MKVKEAAEPSGRPSTSGSLRAQLGLEWETLCLARSSNAHVQRWRLQHTALRDIDTLAALLAYVRSQASADVDDVFAALLSEAHEGDTLAVRALVQLMLPKTVLILNSTRSAAHHGVHDAAEAEAAALSTLVEVLARYPLSRRPRRIAANIALDVLHELSRRRPLELPLDFNDDDDALVKDLIARSFVDCVQSSAELELRDVLDSARQAGVISGADVRMLTLVYSTDERGRWTAGATVAEQLGISPAAMRQRCSRAVRRLATWAAAPQTSPLAA